MISHVLLFALLAAPTQANLNQARQSFSGCLGMLLKTKLQEKVEPTIFESTVAASCKTEEAAFRAAVVSIDVAAGTSRATAEQGANFEITDIVDNTKQRYKDYIETNTMPR